MGLLDNDGATTEVRGSGAKPYQLKNTGGVLSCSCPAWRNQGIPIERRTCKHIRKVQGDAAEDARLGAATAPTPTDPTVAAAEVAKGRKLRGDEKAALVGPPVLLAMDGWSAEDFDPTGWWMSEKLDGVRAYWDGDHFISRQGNVYTAPAWFTAALPQVVLDGELWMGRKAFQRPVSVVRRADGPEAWKDVCFVAFDMPNCDGAFEHRQAVMRALYDGSIATSTVAERYWRVLTQDRCSGMEGMLTRLKLVVGQGAEGLMLRQPGSAYEVGRSSTLLKIKPFSDAEATVIGHTKGKGRHKGRTGALEVDYGGVKFSIGTGLKDADRVKPPPVGARITFRYTELTDGGVPKCASFVAVRDYE